jgi:hypothetical protein
LTAGRTVAPLFFAIDGDRLLEFSAVSAICSLISVGWRDGAGIAAIRVMKSAPQRLRIHSHDVNI